MDALKRMVNSRRFKTLLPWVSAVVLLAGIGAFVGVYFTNTAKKSPGLTNQPAKLPKTQKEIKLPESARRVAGEFILTAVARKDLAKSWPLAHPTLREGFTYKEWLTGDIPVQPYPVGKLNEANFKVDYAYPKEAQIELVLIPKKGVKMQPFQFLMGLRLYRHHWTVDLWQPLQGVPIPNPT
jgi:hypothetical protein